MSGDERDFNNMEKRLVIQFHDLHTHRHTHTYTHIHTTHTPEHNTSNKAFQHVVVSAPQCFIFLTHLFMFYVRTLAVTLCTVEWLDGQGLMNWSGYERKQ